MFCWLVGHSTGTRPHPYVVTMTDASVSAGIVTGFAMQIKGVVIYSLVDMVSNKMFRLHCERCAAKSMAADHA